MESSNDVILSNPGEPLPIVHLPEVDDASTTTTAESEQKQGRRDKLKDQANRFFSKDKSNSDDGPEGRQSMQDRIFSTIMSQIIPSDVPQGENEEEGQPYKKGKQSKKYVTRPELSPRLFAYNFRRFNARIGVLFLAQNQLESLFTWRYPAQTLSFMAFYSLLCLQPHLLPVVPLIFVLFVAMVPAFLARHPTPANDPRVEPSYRGPATAPPSRVRPAPELSVDFWRNMRDLQNFLGDFSTIHDTGNLYITPYTNFSDEPLSSTLFLGAFVLCCLLFLGCSPLVPWRFIALIGGNFLTTLGHSEARRILLSPEILSHIQQHLDVLSTNLRNWVEADIVIDEPPEMRQVEIFELQKHHEDSDTWESWLFSASPYDPLSRARIAGERPKGTQFFEDVQAPTGWIWKEKKWNLDLFSREWVEQRMITGVEIETEGERWVYDIPSEQVDEIMQSSPKSKKGGKAVPAPKSGWEEGTGLERRGEWRRRRWTRMVVKPSPSDKVGY